MGHRTDLDRIMNSVVVVNWEEPKFYERASRALARLGYKIAEDYTVHDSRVTVWSKEPESTSTGRWIRHDSDNDQATWPVERVQAWLSRIPHERLAAVIKPRLKVHLPDGIADWEVDWAANNVIFDLQGKPG